MGDAGDTANKTPEERKHDKKMKSYHNALKYMNGILGFVHLAVAVGFFVWAVADMAKLQLINLYFDPYYYSTSSYVTTLKLLVTYPIIIPFIASPVIAGLACIARVVWLKDYKKSITSGQPYFRWFEFFLAVPTLTWGVAAMVGVTNVMLLISIVLSVAVAVILSSMHGLWALNSVNGFLLSRKEGFKRIDGGKAEPEMSKNLKPWKLFACVTLLNVWPWVIIFSYWGSIGATETPLSNKFQWYRVVGLWLVAACFFASWVAEIVVHYTGARNRRTVDHQYRRVIHEIVMLLISAVATAGTLLVVGIGMATNDPVPAN